MLKAAATYSHSAIEMDYYDSTFFLTQPPTTVDALPLDLCSMAVREQN